MDSGTGVFLSLLLFATGLVTLGLIHRRHVAGVRAERARLFENCPALVEDMKVIERGLDFPVLQGSWRNRHIRIEPVVDTLSLRTLPVLWLVVTIAGHNDVPGRFSALARECGTEFYARHREFGDPVDGADGWARDLSLRSSGWGPAGPGRQALQRIVDAMSGGNVKQVVVAPGSARVVWRTATSQPSTYRVTRRVDLHGTRVDAAALQDVLDATAEILRLAEDSAAESEQVAR